MVFGWKRYWTQYLVPAKFLIVVIGDEFLNHIVPDSLTLPFPLRAGSQVLRQRSKPVMYSLEWATFTDLALASINLSVCCHRVPLRAVV